MNGVDFSAVNITGGFWKIKQDMVRSITAGAVYERFSETHRFDALSCSWREGEPDMPHIFWDSDVAKWIEGVAYLLEKGEEPGLRAAAEDAIGKIIRNCDEDGYFNSHFLVTRTDQRFCHRTQHELYCAGHLMEAAVAWRHATGDDGFLHAMCRYADYIDRVFRVERSAAFTTPGHPELELALIRLYEATGETRYLELATFMIDMHGMNDKGEQDAFEECAFNSLYNQDEMPLRDRTTIDGHCVRALYLYSAAADLARIRGDDALRAACERVMDNAVNKRMYITGGFGSTRIGEAFTVDYDLPNRTAYAETCASIAMAYFASRMQRISADARYADTIERVIYNGMLSGVSMDGRAFFYENPLEIDPDFNDVNVSTLEKAVYPITQRKAVFDCSCCPPNVVRFIPSMAGFMYGHDEETLFVHQYAQSEAHFEGMSVLQETAYPADGVVNLRIRSAGRQIALRIPGWCRRFEVSCPYEMKNGYAVISAEGEETAVQISFDMPVVPMRANRRVHANAGRIAIMRGPVVYCAEGVDNGSDIRCIRLDVQAGFSLTASEFLLPGIEATGWQLRESGSLYSAAGDDWLRTTVRLIPYYAFANRGTTEMAVWLLEK